MVNNNFFFFLEHRKNDFLFYHNLILCSIFYKIERREGDSNPRSAGHHRISNPAPYRAWLSRHENKQFSQLSFLTLSTYLTLFHKVAGTPQVAAIHMHKWSAVSPPPRNPTSDVCSRLVCSLPGLNWSPRSRYKNMFSNKPLYQHHPSRTEFLS